MTFATQFINVFSTHLEKHGFSLIKGTKCFAKLSNNLILYYITFAASRQSASGMKGFSILAGIRTVYSEDISKKYLQSSALDLRAYRWLDPALNNKPGWNLYYYTNDSIGLSLSLAAHETEEFINFLLSAVSDLNSYIDYCKFMLPERISHADTLNLDSSLLILSDNHEHFDDIVERDVKIRFGDDLDKDDTGNDVAITSFRKRISAKIGKEIIEPRDLVFQNNELMLSCYKEIERRKEANKALLMSYGLWQS